jgi:ricin-type beta-trefoil lectin protein
VAALAILALTLLAGAVYGTLSAFSGVTSTSGHFESELFFTPKLDPADPPAVTGAPDEDQALTVSNGTWSHATSFEYQWQACDTATPPTCEDISGAIAATFTVPHDYNSGTALAGKKLRAKVTAVNGSKRTTEQSTSTSATVRTKPKVTAVPTISGTAKEGQQLQSTNGSWDADPPVSGYTYQWQRCTATTCTDVTNATSSTYIVKAADVEKTLRAVVVAENAVGSTSVATSKTASVEIAGTSLVGTATISGKAEVGEVLTASTTWSRGGVAVDDATVTHQWQRCDYPAANCTDVGGATGSTYTIKALDAPNTLRVVANATSTAGSTTTTGSATSDATSDPVAFSRTTWYTLEVPYSGKCVQVNGASTADNSSIDQWTCEPSSLHFQWQFTPTDSGWFRVSARHVPTKGWNVAGGGSADGTFVKLYPYGGSLNEQWKPVPFGDGTYKFLVRESSKCLTVEGVSTANGARMLQWVCNAGANQVFRPVNFAGSASITGTPGVGKVLTASSSWSRNGSAVTDVTVAYKWQACDAAGENCQDIAGQTASTYTVANIAGKPTRRVVATGTSPTAGAATATSEATNVEEAASLTESDWYTMVQKLSGLCVGARSARTVDNTEVEQSKCTAGAYHQQWQLVPTDSGWYRLYNRNAPGQLMEVAGGPAATGNEARTVLFRWVTGNTNQQWKPELQADGTFKLIARHSNKCLDVDHGSAAEGVQLWQWDCNDINSGLPQKFTFIKQPSPMTSLDKWLAVTNRANNLCVNARGAGNTNGTVAEQNNCTGATSQQWKLEATDSGWYRVANRNAPTLYLDVTGGQSATADATPIQLWGWMSNTNQQWKPVGIGDGSYGLVARHSNKCLDVPNGSSASGLQLQQWGCNETLAQSWALTALP